MAEITEFESEQIEQANASGKAPIVLIHGLWLLPSSWDRWRGVFEDSGYATLAPGWPDDPNTVEDAKRHPEVFAHKSVGQVALGRTLRTESSAPGLAVTAHPWTKGRVARAASY
jgi:non-heme chloroperoxidase